MTAPQPRAFAARLYRSQPIRFLVVGGFNTALCFAIYALLVSVGLRFWLANLVALLFGIAIGFFTQGRITFGNADPRRIFRFTATWLGIYVVQTGLIALLVRDRIDPRIAGLIVLPGTVACSYLMQKLVVFRPAATQTPEAK